MRPQFEILADAGACAVHSQGISGQRETWFTVLNRPLDERLFLAIMGPSRREIAATVSLPSEPLFEQRLTVPAHGCCLYEVVIPPRVREIIGSVPYDIKVNCDGHNKVFLLCASPNLDRFSVDHP